MNIRELRPEAKKYLLLLHQPDVFKVMVQIELVKDEIFKNGLITDEFSEISLEEMENLYALLFKYNAALEKIKP